METAYSRNNLWTESSIDAPKYSIKTRKKPVLLTDSSSKCEMVKKPAEGHAGKSF